MSIKNRYIAIAAVTIAALCVFAAYFVLRPQTVLPLPTDQMVNTYISRDYGLIFLYPKDYFAVEREADASHYSIVLYEDTPTAHAIVKGTLEGTEAPPAIAVDMYENPAGLTAEKWVRDTNESNFNLSHDGVITPLTLGGVPALSYTWSGLYEGRTIALAHAGRIYAFSVGFLASDDRILSDFDLVTASATFTK